MGGGGGGGHRVNPFRVGYGYFLESHNMPTPGRFLK